MYFVSGKAWQPTQSRRGDNSSDRPTGPVMWQTSEIDARSAAGRKRFSPSSGPHIGVRFTGDTLMDNRANARQALIRQFSLTVGLHVACRRRRTGFSARLPYETGQPRPSHDAARSSVKSNRFPKSTTRVIAGSGHCKQFLPRMAKNFPLAGCRERPPWRSGATLENVLVVLLGTARRPFPTAIFEAIPLSRPR